MNSISRAAKNVVQAAFQGMNKNKEVIKNISGCATFIFGLIAVHDGYKIFQGRKVSTQMDANEPRWIQMANKATIVSAKISLILSASVSRPGVYLISNLLGSVTSTQTLEKIWGPNTICAVNPRHPRHITSIAATILGAPATLQCLSQGIYWVYKKVRQYHKLPTVLLETGTQPTDFQIRLMTCINEFSSRPVLHWGNSLAHKLF